MPTTTTLRRSDAFRARPNSPNLRSAAKNPVPKTSQEPTPNPALKASVSGINARQTTKIIHSATYHCPWRCPPENLEQRSPYLERKLAAPPHPHPPAAGAPSTAPEGGSVAHIEHAKSTSRASEGCTDDFVHRRTTENRSEGRKTNQCSEPTTEQAAKKCAEKSTPEGAPNGMGGPCWERDMLRTDSCNH